LVEGIGGKKFSRAPQFLNRSNPRFAPFFVATQDGHLRARGRQAFRHRATEYARGTQDHGHLFGQVK
jgi:hypothetical protein